MRRAVVVILGVAIVALLVARYAHELFELVLRLPLVVLDAAAALARGILSLLQQLATDAGPVLAPIGTLLADLASDPGATIGAAVSSVRDLIGGIVTATRDAVSDWWAWASAQPETVTVVLFWAFVGIGAVAIARRRARAARPRRRSRDL